MVEANIESSERTLDAASAIYAKEVVGILTDQLIHVIEQRHIEVLPYVRGESSIPTGDKKLLLGILQAWGIWFQLLNVPKTPKPHRKEKFQ